MLDRARVREVYLEAAALPDDQRPALLDRLCADDAALRAEVESLLASAARRPGFLGSPTTAPPEAPGEAAGTRIGPYRLLQEIGRGGFGTVYMAEQDEPVHRRVALKIIKLGMDTRAVIARFDAERQALAMMDHAHIARVFDAGATESGRPYFVMELVRGEPITAYCDRNSLSIPERLDLFVQVCHAVQHAHGKGVIHRDLKPGNILVATEDGRPHAKVIDFGIAKATDHRLTEKTVFTDFRQFVGTPEYMSPEQAEGSFNIDTRSDIYSLGVLLYELLTGGTPFDPGALRSAAYAEVQRIIRDVEPERPSTRLSRSASRALVATQRHTEPRRLSALVRGELDWIVMKALDKERARRYETASALAADIARHLAGEPVEAAPPSGAYRLRKFVRRNRTLVAAGSAVAVALVLGVIGTSIGLVRANAARAGEEGQRKAAQESARIAGEEARRAATAEAGALARATELERVAAFQASQLAEIDAAQMGSRLRDDVLGEASEWLARTEPDEGARAERLGVIEEALDEANFTDVALRSLDRTIFERAIAAIDRDFADQPRVRARLLRTVGESLFALGLYEEAIDPQTRGMELSRATLGAEHPETLNATSALGLTLLRLGRLGEAAGHIRPALEAQERTLGPDDPDSLTSTVYLGQLLEAEGSLADAEAALRRALDGWRRVRGEADADALAALKSLGLVIKARGRVPEAEPLFRRGLELSRAMHGDEDARTLAWMNNLCDALYQQGKFDEGGAYGGVELIRKQQRALGDDHPAVLPIILNTGVGLLRKGRAAEAETFFREARDRMRRVLGAGHISTLTATANLAIALQLRGALGEASDVYAEGMAASAGGGAASSPIRAVLLHHYADILRVLGRLDEAKYPAVEAVELYRAHRDWNPHEAVHAEKVLRDVLVARGEHAEAELAVRALLARLREARPIDEYALADALSLLAGSVMMQGRFADAVPAWRECLEIRTRIIPEGSARAWVRWYAMGGLGRALIGEASDESLPLETRLAKFQEAETLVLTCYNGMKDDASVPLPAAAGGDDVKGTALLRIVSLYEAWERAQPGVGYGAKAAEWRRQAAEPANSGPP